MKKVFVLFLILLVAILGSQEVFGKKEPCAPYYQNRNMEEVRIILTNSGPYFDNLRIAYARAYSTLTGENISATVAGMRIMLEKCEIVHKSYLTNFDPSDYLNGVKIGEEVSFEDVIGAESQYWLVPKEKNGNNYLGVIGKVACVNPQLKKTRGVNPGRKLFEFIVIDTLVVRIEDNNRSIDSIFHIEYNYNTVNNYEQPRKVVVREYVESGYYTDFSRWMMPMAYTSFPQCYNNNNYGYNSGYSYNCYSTSEMRMWNNERYDSQPFQKNEDHRSFNERPEHQGKKSFDEPDHKRFDNDKRPNFDRPDNKGKKSFDEPRNNKRFDNDKRPDNGRPENWDKKSDEPEHKGKSGAERYSVGKEYIDSRTGQRKSWSTQGSGNNQNPGYQRQAGSGNNQNPGYQRQAGSGNNQNPGYQRQAGSGNNQNPGYQRR